MTYTDWLDYGMARGWCSGILCAQHDGIFTDDETEQIWEGDDPCAFVVRLHGEGSS